MFAPLTQAQIEQHSPVVNKEQKQQSQSGCELDKKRDVQNTISYEKLIKLAGKKHRIEQLYISVQEFAAKSKKYTKIDIRKEKDFYDYRIAGSINLQPFELHSKEFFKAKDIVIIDYGYRFGVVQKLAADLAAKGFKKVKILDGGINSWIRYGGKTDGDKFKRTSSELITAKQYQTQIMYKEWHPVILRNVAVDKRALVQIPGAVEIDIRNKSESQVAELINKQISSWLDIGANIELLIIPGKEINSWYMDEVVNKIPYPNLYLLKDGIKAYQKEVQMRQLASSYDGKRKGAKKCGLQ